MAIKTSDNSSAIKTYYYKMVALETHYVIGWGKIISSKKPSSTSTRFIITKADYDALVIVSKNKPAASDDSHEVRIVDNMDGTYDYVEVEKPIVEDFEE